MPVHRPREPAQTVTTRTPSTLEGQRWASVLVELERLAEDELGNRSRKAVDVLRRSERSEAGVLAAIDDIEQLSILFVDARRLGALAADMRARVGVGEDA